MLPEVFLEKNIDSALEHHRVIDGNHANILDEVPAWLATASLRSIHNVVCNQHECLEDLDHPSQRRSREELCGRQRAIEKN